jgi:HEAT repeat protein
VVAVVLFLIGVASWLPRGFLRATYNLHTIRVSGEEAREARLGKYLGTCTVHSLPDWADAAVDDAIMTGSAGEPEKALDCLARLQPAGSARAFFESLTTAQPDPEKPQERRRRLVGLVLALGRAAEDDACQAALVVTRSLAQLGTRRATQCYVDAASRGTPDGRAAAAANLSFLALNLHVDASDAFDLAARLASDSDPTVRAAASSSLVLFDERTARKLLTPLSADPEPAVRAAAEETLAKLEPLRQLEEALSSP